MTDIERKREYANTLFCNVEFDNAYEVYTRQLTEDNYDQQCYNNLGVIEADKKNFQRAEYCLQRALDIDANYKQAWSNLGNVAYEQQIYDKAMQCYNNALEIDSEYITALENLSACYKKTKKFSEAIRTMKKVKRLLKRQNKVSILSLFKLKRL